MNGQCVFAAEEERFSRKKHTGDFPIRSIEHCLRENNLRLEDIDEIVHAFNYAPYETIFSFDPVSSLQYREVYSRQTLLSQFREYLPQFPVDRIKQVDHHLAHAASAYFTSGWDECLTIVIDGMGEVDGVSVYVGRNGKLEKIHRIPAADSIGIFYSLVTLHLGFDFNADEYKIMGLAPYGNPEPHKAFFNRVVTLCGNGSFRIPILRMNKTRLEQETYASTRQFLNQNLIAERQPSDDIRDEHCNVAAALQQCLETTLLYLCNYFGSTTGIRKLALAGGVALNCTANGKLMRSGRFDSIYIQPAAGDDGAALGAALARAASAGNFPNRRQSVPFLGPAYSNGHLAGALKDFADQIEVTPFSSLEETCDAAARLIADSKVIAWYRGRMEFGPRALGHRSILADPSHPDMRDRINAMVKMRESFRPFAPAVALEEASRWFEIEEGMELPYMITIVDVREQYQADLPAITHVNGTARVQTVSPVDNKEFHVLLQSVGKATGRQMVLNTSFNVKGQPIVNTPHEAIETYLRTGIDFLFLENCLIQRKHEPEMKI